MKEIVDALLASKEFMTVLDKSLAPAIAVIGVTGAAIIALVGTWYKARVDQDLAKANFELQKQLIDDKLRVDRTVAAENATYQRSLLQEKAGLDRESAVRGALSQFWPPVSAALYHTVARTQVYSAARAPEVVSAKRDDAVKAAQAAKEAYQGLRAHLPELSAFVAELARLPDLMDHQRGDVARAEELIRVATQLREALDLLLADCLRSGRLPSAAELMALREHQEAVRAFWAHDRLSLPPASEGTARCDDPPGDGFLTKTDRGS